MIGARAMTAPRDAGAASRPEGRRRRPQGHDSQVSLMSDTRAPNPALDQSSIIHTTQACAEDLEQKARGKKLSCAAKMAKKRREADAVQVELMDRDKKISELTNQNRIAEAELTGTENENRKLETEIDVLHQDLEAAQKAYDK